ncbi:hypothetical protein M1466_03355 [Candidatus Dependentiae bacterium]|nr:hypothetical protein [Candidatus Dependentiae bacterium]
MKRMKIPTDSTTLKGVVFIVAGSVLLIFFAGSFILYATGIITGLWLLNKGLSMVGLPNVEHYARSLITIMRTYY